MLDDVLAIPDHLRDALWRVEGARVEPAACAGLLVCGMGGSAIGADLAQAALGDRLERPMATARGYSIPSWVTPDWGVLCTSYSGDTEETLSCFEAAGTLGARRIVGSTGGALVEQARDAGVPVVGLPGVFQPRAAVAYMFVVAAEAAALFGVAPRIAEEIEGAALSLDDRKEELRSRASSLAEELGERVPVFCGAGLTGPVARRWKTQMNENAKLHAFFNSLPEADHNAICAWVGDREPDRFSLVLLRGGEENPRLRRRFELTADAVSGAGVRTILVEPEGEGPVARMFWTVMLGDLLSLELAAARGVDPSSVPAIEALKDALGQP
jgi:glucose/mannose-6-phosphate isomerase